MTGLIIISIDLVGIGIIGLILSILSRKEGGFPPKVRYFVPLYGIVLMFKDFLRKHDGRER